MALIIPSLFRIVPYLDTEQLLDTPFWPKLQVAKVPIVSIWLKCWLQQIVSQSCTASPCKDHNRAS